MKKIIYLSGNGIELLRILANEMLKYPKIFNPDSFFKIFKKDRIVETSFYEIFECWIDKNDGIEMDIASWVVFILVNFQFAAIDKTNYAFNIAAEALFKYPYRDAFIGGAILFHCEHWKRIQDWNVNYYERHDAAKVASELLKIANQKYLVAEID